ncbi:MAG: surface-adhesin E family protein [Steroidobacterales bacterium]
MRTHSGAAVLAVALCALPLAAGVSVAQTPAQQSAWDAERGRALADQKARNERIAEERAARKADVMGWVRTLDPMSAGGWEFRAASSDASWAAFSTVHQLQRSGKAVTAWLRQEFAEPQQDPRGGSYLSFVQQVEFDCQKNRVRAHLLIYYADNNLKGVTQSIEVDQKQAPWGPIVPGTLDESNFQWACSPDREKGAR